MNPTPQKRLKIQRELIGALQDKVQALERKVRNQAQTIKARQDRIRAMEDEIIRLRKIEEKYNKQNSIEPQH